MTGKRRREDCKTIRKRTKQYIASFKIKPESCYERLLKVIRFGSSPEDIEKFYDEWRELVKDLESVCNKEAA
ncbi:hypothetical protein B0P06_000235 [Clostridium saccharoperbutylacetonicum]|uniref:hypothetical protein n=1 Tax=Clostridium saccharoperbutylacetonicum TaxID=36745 RepID=UPI000348AFC3|nr:hypothetical protein [Clostridium saccharoperbutylacetonicum]NRT63617.1 hypothetical protein [Clostridium saccharoperbutylacetonicum]NSB26980.1 hypothetical protein [Clostridium saccharoperbutylacetonicum]NSB40464.1 hypothetical protein [Clostridium saccharoperbutylacetonicum]